jgi:chromosome segregation ATPase
MDFEKAVVFLTENAARHDAQLGAIAENIARHDAQIAALNLQVEALLKIAAYHDAGLTKYNTRITWTEDAFQKLADTVLNVGSHIELLANHMDNLADKMSESREEMRESREEMRQRDAQSRERDARMDERIAKLAEAIAARGNGKSHD